MKITSETLRRVRDGVVPLVDGDPAGDGYITDLLALVSPPRRVLQLPASWTIEDVLKWIVTADEPNLLAGVGAALDRAFANSAALLTELKKPTNQGGLKTDYLGYENLIGAFRSSGPITPGALNGASVGPFYIDWESQASTDAEMLMGGITFDATDEAIDTAVRQVPIDRPGGRELQAWVDRQRRVLDRRRLSREELASHAARICQQLRAVRVTADSRLVAMTIHQAKNREFERVVILWPYQVSANAETARRLLYNAVTRAKVRATIIVQNVIRNGRNRLNQPPFTA